MGMRSDTWTTIFVWYIGLRIRRQRGQEILTLDLANKSTNTPPPPSPTPTSTAGPNEEDEDGRGNTKDKYNHFLVPAFTFQHVVIFDVTDVRQTHCSIAIVIDDYTTTALRHQRAI
jgi:hypothetical protein